MTTTEAVARLKEAWQGPTTVLEWLTTVDHKALGTRYIVTAFAFFLIGGVLAILIRSQLALPENGLLSPDMYNRVFTMHGTTMIFLFATPMVTGLGVYIVPLMIGTREMAFPRLNALAYWVFLLAGLFIHFSWVAGAVPDIGWFGYTPLSGPVYSPSLATDFWALGIVFVGLSTTMAAINFIVTILKLRAPGMAIQRIPLFIWGILDSAFTMLVAVPAVTLAAVFLTLDRKLGMDFFDASAGGSPLLWQHLFWLWGHPEVYILLLPALGIVSAVIAAFARRPIMTYSLVVLASVTISIFSLDLWVHHMFTVGLNIFTASLFTAASLAISIASGITIFAWLGTLWLGKLVLKTPLLYVLGFIFTFVLGGITGVMVAVVPFDRQVHDSFFVVAHFHYVLVGGVVFPIFAAIHYWIPKISGRMYNEFLGQASFWLVFVGFNITFLPQHILGFQGMPRRVYTYLEATGWGQHNLISTIGSYILGVGILIILFKIIWSVRNGSSAGDDPWEADTLEWAASSPPPGYNFARLPVVRSLTPLWDRRGAAATAHPVETLEDPLANGREVVTTSVLDGAPEQVIRLPGSSYAPLATALGLLLIFTGAIISSLVVMAVGLATVAVAVALWLWRAPRSNPERIALVTGDAQRLQAGRPSSLGRWGMILFVVSEAALFTALVSSYFLTRGESAEWPLGGIEPPTLTIPVILTLIIIFSSLAMILADVGERRGFENLTRLGLVAVLILGLAFLGLQGYEYSRESFSFNTNAYSSLFFTITGAHGAHLLLGTLMVAWTLASAMFRPRGSRGAEVATVSIYWHFIGVVWLIIFGALYLGARWL